MTTNPSSLKATVAAFMRRQGIPPEMEQNLVKETVHLYLLSALSESGLLGHVVFQGGTALRLCYGGERYSEDLDFVCGRSGSYLNDIEFENLIGAALAATRRSLQLNFGIDPEQVALTQAARPGAIREASLAVAAWQIAVPIAATPRAPRSRIRIEFANVPSYANLPMIVRSTPGLVQIQDVILPVESANEILADKAVALTARPRLKYRDLWDVWYLKGKFDAKVDREMVQRKFGDYGTTEVEARARRRLDELSSEAAAKAFLEEMKRFLPAKRIAETTALGLQHTILAEGRELIARAVLPG
jgi:predicted nucleotidyltransferase component of viral defense system